MRVEILPIFQIIFLFLLFGANAQQRNRPSQLIETGLNELDARNYPEAISLFEKAVDEYKIHGSLHSYTYALNLLAEAHWRNGDIESGRQIVLRALEQSKLIDDSVSRDSLTATINYNLGNINIRSANYLKAIENLEISLEKYCQLHGETHIQSSKVHYSQALAHYYLGRYDQAIVSMNKSLKIKEELFGSTRIDIATGYSNLGDFYRIKGDLDKAVMVGKKGLDLKKKLMEENNPSLGASYNNLGIAFELRGEYQKAIEFYEKAVTIKQTAYGKNHPSVSSTYDNLGVIYDELVQYDDAMYWYRKSLKNRLVNYGPNHPIVASSYNNIGSLYVDHLKFDSAIFYIQSSLNIRKASLGENHPLTGSSLITLGRAYAGMGDFDSAIQSFLRVKAIYKEANLLSATIDINNRIAQLLVEDNRIYEAFSLIENTIALNITEEGVLDQQLLLASLLIKATAWFHLEDTASSEKKRSIVDLLYQADSLANKLRHSRTRYTDKLVFGRTVEKLYQSAVSLCLHFAKKDIDYFDDAFYFSQRSKAAVLAENLSERSVRQFIGVPQSLIELEHELRTDASYFLTRIQDLTASDTKELSYMKNQLARTNQRLDSLIKSLEIDYPQYYAYKYQNSVLSSWAIQDQLASDEAILDYFESDSAYYVFLLIDTEKQSFTIKKTDSLQKNLDSFTSLLRDRANQPLSSDEFKELSHSVFAFLLGQPFSMLKGKSRLKIIPPGELFLFPWDLLVTDLEGDSYRNFNYLFKRHSISYELSSNLLFQERQTNSNSSSGVLAFAPSYTGDFDQADFQEVLRNELVPLTWNQEEVTTIVDLLDGQAKIGNNATEKIFKQDAPNFQILHLAMHALIDHDQFLQSKLVFSQGTDSTDDGFLHVYELYNMSLPVEMVVLSACNTGLGKIERGEGVLSLANAFSYAGCPSVVMSHWNVNDQSTAILMNLFYQFLKEGDPKDIALQKAKLQFLSDAKEIHIDPFYWGAFAVLGDPEPLYSKDHSLYIIISIGVTVLIVSSIWFKSTFAD